MITDEMICQYIDHFLQRNRYAPSIQDLCEFFGWKSRSSGHKRLGYMKRKGLVEWNPGDARTLRVVHA